VIVPESSLLLYQREFLKGDVVKRSLVAVESAVIVDIRTEVQLEHIMSRERLRNWVPFDKLRNGMAIEARDKVIYDEWIGTVEEVSSSNVPNRVVVLGVDQRQGFRRWAGRRQRRTVLSDSGDGRPA
jgi:hypothetical protein